MKSEKPDFIYPVGWVELDDALYAVVFSKSQPGKPPSEAEVAQAVAAVTATFPTAHSWSDVSELP